MPEQHQPQMSGRIASLAGNGLAGSVLAATLAALSASFVAQPCLVIGNGGVGHRVVLNLLAHLIAIYGQVPAGIRLMVFDIDQENLSVRVGNRLVALERDAELFCLGPLPVARIRYNLDKFPTIRDRLPSLEAIAPIGVVHAAKQQRPIGNLAFQWQFPRIQSQVQSALWRLAGRDQRGDQSLIVDPSRGLKVIQVGSNCGGTNAGMFIDLGFLVRHELAALGQLGDASTVIGIGVLPGAFRGVSGPNLAPNTVASLLELEAVTMNGHQPLAYRDGTVIQTGRPPFDMYLLVDAVDEGGRVWVNQDDLYRMLARAILVMAASRLGEQGEGELDNLDDVLSQRTTDGHGTFFGSVGLSVLEFPAQAIVDLFTARQGEAAILAGLLRQADQPTALASAQAWLQSLGLSAAALPAELARDEAGLPLAVTLDAPSSLRRLQDHQAPQEAIQYVQAYGRLRVDGDFRAAARRQAQALAERAGHKLESDVQATLDDPRWGLRHCQALLHTLGQQLGQMHAALTAQRQSIRSEETQAEHVAAHATEELIRAPETPWPFRHSKVSSSLDRYLQASQAALALRLDGLALEQALTVVASLASRSRELAQRLARLEGRLQAAAALLAEEARKDAGQINAGGPRRGHPALVLVDEPYLEQLYSKHAPELKVTLSTLTARIGKAGLLSWLELDPAQLAQEVCEASRPAFLPILAMTVEDVLAATGHASAASPQARLAALLDEAQPAWNLDETRLPGGGAGLRRITVVGVTDHTRSIFRGNGTQAVSIHDPHTVLALSLTVGAPYTALQAWPAYLAEYERVRRQRPLHTLPAFQQEGREARLALALGMLFGQIVTRGVYVYYRPVDELLPEQRLAQGVANSIRALTNRDGLVREIMEWVEAHIEHIGTGQALKGLADYCKPAAGDDDLSRELKQAVRDYADMLRANTRAAGR